MPKLSDTQLVLLSNAAKRDDGAIVRPAKSHPPALANAIKSLLSLALVRTIAKSGQIPVWDTNADGSTFSLVVTPAGLEAIGVEAPMVNDVVAEMSLSIVDAGCGKIQSSGRSKSKARQFSGATENDGAITPPPSSSPIRTGSKLSTVVEMMRSPEGATLKDIMQATSWQAHSVRGAISGAIKKKLGLSVSSETRGDDRVYRIAG
jgi:hypothetical protein